MEPGNIGTKTAHLQKDKKALLEETQGFSNSSRPNF
jgi:hypothetical protein